MLRLKYYLIFLVRNSDNNNTSFTPKTVSHWLTKELFFGASLLESFKVKFRRSTHRKFLLCVKIHPPQLLTKNGRTNLTPKRVPELLQVDNVYKHLKKKQSKIYFFCFSLTFFWGVPKVTSP